MNLERAIEILTIDKIVGFVGDTAHLDQALQLGIEALKRIQDIRYDHRNIAWLLLPGEETEEQM